MRRVQTDKYLGNSEWIEDWSVFFGDFIWTAIIDHDRKEVRPCHGYFVPHPIGIRNRGIAKRLGYTFNNN